MRRFQILKGLPGTGPRPIPFPPHSRAEFSEGFVVEFYPETQASWVANFLLPFHDSMLSAVYEYPEWDRLVIIADGTTWTVDPNDPNVTTEIDHNVKAMYEFPSIKILVLQNYFAFNGFGKHGLLWKSRRISWDGFRAIVRTDHFLEGESWTPLDKNHEWVPFRLNVLTGQHEGGAYTAGDM